MNRRKIVILFLACLYPICAPTASFAAADAKKREAMNAIRKLAEATKASAEGMADQLAGQYIAYLTKTEAMLDGEKITNPIHRFHFFGQSKDTMQKALLDSFDTFAAATQSSWSKKAPALLPALEQMFRTERDGLEEFLRIDPVLILGACKSSSEARTIMSLAKTADAQEAANLSFADRMRRAAAKSEAELKKVVRAEVGTAASNLVGQLSENYDSFLVVTTRALEAQGITDTAVRDMILGPKSREVGASMMTQYDKFAAATRASFKGTGNPIEPTVAEVLDVQRARLAVLVKSESPAAKR